MSGYMGSWVGLYAGSWWGVVDAGSPPVSPVNASPAARLVAAGRIRSRHVRRFLRTRSR